MCPVGHHTNFRGWAMFKEFSAMDILPEKQGGHSVGDGHSFEMFYGMTYFYLLRSVLKTKPSLFCSDCRVFIEPISLPR